MTPFDVGLRHELEAEELRFANDWLFKWYNLRNSIDVDRFDGGRICLGGIVFGDQQQSIFWQSIGKYLANKAHEIFQKWDDGTKGYSVDQRKASLEVTYHLTNGLVSGVIRRGIKTDQALRGMGHPKTDEPYQAGLARARVHHEIEQLKAAHAGMLQEPTPEMPPEKRSLWRTSWDAVGLRPGIFGFSIDLKKLFGLTDRSP